MKKISLTLKDIEAVIVKKEFMQVVATTLTICVLTLENGFTVTGESACVDPNNFDKDIGEEIAYENAREKIWQLEGYLLKSKLHNAIEGAHGKGGGIVVEDEVKTMMWKIDDGVAKTAEVCHEANRAYCLALGDDSQLAWSDAPEWQKTSAVNGVLFQLQNLDSTPPDSHANWLAEKAADGWKYGEVKDVEKKEHPCFVPYSELPAEQRAKDYIFSAIAKTLGQMLC